jgi:predicted transcriptional regulator
MAKSDQTVPPQSELDVGEYRATVDELAAIDAALASIDRGEVATEREVRAIFAKFRRG